MTGETLTTPLVALDLLGAPRTLRKTDKVNEDLLLGMDILADSVIRLDDMSLVIDETEHPLVGALTNNDITRALSGFEDIFFNPDKPLRTMTGVTPQEVRTNDAAPINQMAYRTPLTKRKVINGHSQRNDLRNSRPKWTNT